MYVSCNNHMQNCQKVKSTHLETQVLWYLILKCQILIVKIIAILLFRRRFCRLQTSALHTLRALVPAYCLLMISPLFAQSSWNMLRMLGGMLPSGGIRPSLENWISITAFANAVWNMIVGSKEVNKQTSRSVLF